MAIKAKASCFIEVSWEVCNKVGGINTVIKSKQRFIQDFYKDKYWLIGPYLPTAAEIEFEEQAPPDMIKNVFSELKKQGLNCYYGIFNGSNTILIDFSGLVKEKDKIKTEMWENYKVDSLKSPYDFDEPLVWSYAVGMLIEKLKALMNGNCVVQFHEWLTGAGLLYLKKNNVNINTVFTTHATVLGRAFASQGNNVFELKNGEDLEKLSYNLGVHSKHQLEKASAQAADVFTTVSEITSMEAEKVLGRKADVLLPNGLDMEKFPTFEETSIKHGIAKNRLKEFLMYYFFPYYNFNLDNTLFYFTAGRYELRNKGFDVLIRSLGELNKRMKAEGNEKTIISFLWIPTKIKGIKTFLLENKSFYNDISEFVENYMWLIEQNIISSILTKSDPQKISFNKEFLMEAKRKGSGYSKSGRPLLVTHDIFNEENDAILNLLRKNGLLNRKEDKVKVIFYPAYLTGTDGLLDMKYYDAISGCHLGLFPSNYEPWGYTPLETGALGVPAVTTDLTGFGRTLMICKGICVLPREKLTDDDFVNKLTDYLHKFANYSKATRVKNKLEAKKLAETADWKKLIVNYIQAHNLSIEKRR